MSRKELDNLFRVRKLKQEPASPDEIAGLPTSCRLAWTRPASERRCACDGGQLLDYWPPKRGSIRPLLSDGLVSLLKVYLLLAEGPRIAQKWRAKDVREFCVNQSRKAVHCDAQDATSVPVSG